MESGPRPGTCGCGRQLVTAAVCQLKWGSDDKAFSSDAGQGNIHRGGAPGALWGDSSRRGSLPQVLSLFQLQGAPPSLTALKGLWTCRARWVGAQVPPGHTQAVVQRASSLSQGQRRAQPALRETRSLSMAGPFGSPHRLLLRMATCGDGRHALPAPGPGPGQEAQGAPTPPARMGPCSPHRPSHPGASGSELRNGPSGKGCAVGGSWSPASPSGLPALQTQRRDTSPLRGLQGPRARALSSLLYAFHSERGAPAWLRAGPRLSCWMPRGGTFTLCLCASEGEAAGPVLRKKHVRSLHDACWRLELYLCSRQ